MILAYYSKHALINAVPSCHQALGTVHEESGPHEVWGEEAEFPLYTFLSSNPHPLRT